MNTYQIIEFISYSVDVKDWNNKRRELLNSCTTQFEKDIVVSECDTKGLIVKVLGKDMHYTPTPKPVEQPTTQEGVANE